MEDGIENEMSLLKNDNLTEESVEKKYAYLFIPNGYNEWEDSRIIFDKNVAIEISIKHKKSRIEVFWFNKKEQMFLPLYAYYKDGVYIEND